MEKNPKQLVSEYCQRTRLPNPLYVCTPDQEKNPNGFFCTMTVGDQSFCTSTWNKTKKAAELEAAKLACAKLALSQADGAIKAMKMEEKQAPVLEEKAPIVKDPEWITIEKVEDIYKYLTDEILAQEFKAFLHCKAQEEKKGYPVFSVTDAEESKGYIGMVTYNEVQYKSLGIMLTRKQAEQSAAEVCLRSLGDFPAVEKDKYTIQVYRGGQIHIPPTSKKHGTPRREFTRIMASLLQLLAGSLNMQYPSYRYKAVMEGEAKKFTAAVFFEGKLFESTTATDTMLEAKEVVAEEAVKYLGIIDPQEAHKIRYHTHIKRRRTLMALGILQSPLIYCPSKRPRWIFYHFEPLDEMTGVKLTYKDDTQNLLEIRKLQDGQTGEEVVALAMDAEPSIGDQKLSDITDLCIGKINNANKNKMIIGNNECSFPIFCEDGKIMCNKRKAKVELLPGHNVRGLKCTYEFMYPSLRVYLKAESCEELVYPKSQLPVLSECGVVILMYDHEANAEDLHILLTRSSDKKTFVTKAKYLASYLNKQLSTNPSVVSQPSRFNVADCVQNITTWTHKEVQLMSEMTVESMHELMSLYVRYDERWNDTFNEHTDVLKQLKAAAEEELARRTKEGIEDEDETEPWLLPHHHFQPRLIPTGVYVEDSLMCTFRSVYQITGLKLKLSDLEEAPFIDLPVKDEANARRGDVCRYAIWKGLRRVSGDEEEPYYLPKLIADKLGDGYIDADFDRRRSFRRDGKKGGKRKFQDAENAEVKTANGDASEPMEEDKRPVPMDSRLPDRPYPFQDPPNMTKGVHLDCRWIPLEEAKSMCAPLMELAKQQIFQDQVKALQLEANAFEKEKAEANGVK